MVDYKPEKFAGDTDKNRATADQKKKAKKGCDKGLEECIKRASAELVRGYMVSENKEDETKYEKAYERALKTCKWVHEWNHKLIDKSMARMTVASLELEPRALGSTPTTGRTTRAWVLSLLAGPLLLASCVQQEAMGCSSIRVDEQSLRVLLDTLEQRVATAEKFKVAAEDYLKGVKRLFDFGRSDIDDLAQAELAAYEARVTLQECKEQLRSARPGREPSSEQAARILKLLEAKVAHGQRLVIAFETIVGVAEALAQAMREPRYVVDKAKVMLRRSELQALQLRRELEAFLVRHPKIKRGR